MQQDKAMGSARRRVLVADDEDVVRELLVAILGGRHECTAVADAETALDALEAERFDVVLTDVRMAGMSGLELCEIIRRRWPATAVVIVSGHTDRDEAMQAGAAEFIPKPFDIARVLEVVERAATHWHK